MCVGVPTKILSCDGLIAQGQNYLGHEETDLALVGEQEAGVWVLCFLGSARAVISQAEAQKIEAALLALQAVQNGGTLGDAFDDITKREPKLPAHLQDAFNRLTHQEDA